MKATLNVIRRLRSEFESTESMSSSYRAGGLCALADLEKSLINDPSSSLVWSLECSKYDDNDSLISSENIALFFVMSDAESKKQRMLNHRSQDERYSVCFASSSVSRGGIKKVYRVVPVACQ